MKKLLSSIPLSGCVVVALLFLMAFASTMASALSKERVYMLPKDKSNMLPKEKTYLLKSPDQKIVVDVKVAGDITFSVKLMQGAVPTGEKHILNSRPISLVLDNGEVLGQNPTVVSAKFFDKREKIVSPFYKFSSVDSYYKMLDIKFKEGFGVIFAACDQGVAYRFYTVRPGGLTVKNECGGFDFDADYSAWIPYLKSSKYNIYQASFQSTYDFVSLSKADTSRFSLLPMVVDLAGGVKITIAESDLESYPGMFLKTTGGKSLVPAFAPYPAQTYEQEKRHQEMVGKSENFIARVKGPRTFPWRIMAVSTADTQLPVNNMVYELGGTCRVADPSWIMPGKVAWDWWCDWGLYGVDFKAGVNNQTYKYYIDFAAANKLEYVVLDEGWSLPQLGDVMSHIPEIDLVELVNYASAQKVGLILWTVSKVLDNKLEEACKYYSGLGIKGFKVDFFDRDDQLSVERVYRIAQKCADYKLVLDLHGIYKPTGLNRTFPNILNFEGVFGLEELKWNATADMVQYNVTFPFIRMFAGPVDYTQGAMNNSIKVDFRAIYSSPMSQGTRAHQLGTYIVFDSPLVMLCDSPTTYAKEQECTDFIASLPTVYDYTQILQGAIGEYIVTLRRVAGDKSGSSWYIGGLNNWTPRKVTIDFSFLGDNNSIRDDKYHSINTPVTAADKTSDKASNKPYIAEKIYTAEIFRDGINAAKRAVDYKKEIRTITASTKLEIDMAPGGGFAIVVK